MVGLSKIERSGSSRESRSRTLATICVASSECPPSSKKSSSIPTEPCPSSSPQTSASARSVAVSGAR